MPDAAGLVLIDCQGRLLLFRQGGTGRWQVPCAARSSGESAKDAAVRAFREAPGFAVARVRRFGAAGELELYFADDDAGEALAGALSGGRARWFAPADLHHAGLPGDLESVLRAFLQSDLYQGTIALKAPYRRGASVLALDRWGRVLLQLRDDDLPPERFPGQWSLPGGLLTPGEAPDAGALREFEEETGQALEGLSFFRTYRKSELPGANVDTWHVYFADPDIPEEAVEVREGQAFAYFAPGELEGLAVPPPARTILEQFFASPAYRALFH